MLKAAIKEISKAPAVQRLLGRTQHVVSKLMVAPPLTARPPSVEAYLGLAPDAGYASRCEQERQACIRELEGCSPAGSRPAEMLPYLTESALRFRGTIDLLRAVLGPLRAGRILEIGCNPYFCSILLRQELPGFEWAGVNYFGGSLPAGSQQTQQVVDPKGRLTEARFLHADVERHPLEGEDSHDATLFCEVLEHLPFDPAWALYNTARTIRPGGVLLLSTPNPRRLENLRRLVTGEGSMSDPISGHGIHGRHNREYTAGELVDLLEGTGLRIEQARTIDVFPSEYTRSAESSGLGAYHLFAARRPGKLRVFRPAWLYRSYAPEMLTSAASLAPA